MKKINSSKQLRAEKKRLQVQQENLETKIRSDWKALKESLKPANMAKETLQEVVEKTIEANKNGESVLKSTFTYGMNLLVKKFADKAGTKLDRIFK